MKNLANTLLLITLTLALSVTSAWAQELSPYTVRKVLRSYKLQQKEQFNEAIDTLTQINSGKEYDRAYINRMLGGLYWQASKPGKAIEHLSLAVASKQLTETEQKDTCRMLADILMMQGEYKLAEARYTGLLSMYQHARDKEWIWLRVAQAQYQQRKWASVEKSISKQQKYLHAAKLTAKVMPLNMMLSAQLAQKKWKHAIATTKSLRELQPANALWWRQLITLYMLSENHASALVTLQQAERAKFNLTKQQLKLMAQLYAQSGVPYKAAQTYQKLADINESAALLSQQAVYWQQAKEWDNALVSWRKAAELKADYYRQYALLKMRLRDYAGALEAINKVPSQDASILLSKAQALNELGEVTQALNAASKAHRLKPSENTISWVKFLTALNKR